MHLHTAGECVLCPPLDGPYCRMNLICITVMRSVKMLILLNSWSDGQNLWCAGLSMHETVPMRP